jgi:hypothetical protein
MIFKRIELNISAVGVPQKKGKMMSAGKTRLGWKKKLALTLLQVIISSVKQQKGRPSCC